MLFEYCSDLGGDRILAKGHFLKRYFRDRGLFSAIALLVYRVVTAIKNRKNDRLQDAFDPTAINCQGDARDIARALAC
jgi:hypothetical protein